MELRRDKVLFVTALFRPPGDERDVYRKLDVYLDLGRHLVGASVPLRVYTSPDLEPLLRLSWQGLQVDHVEVETGQDIEGHWRRSDLELPTGRNLAKDTPFYLSVQLSKLKFAAHAACSAAFISWIDFGIFHMLRDVPSAQARLRRVAELLPRARLPPLVILSPAGHEGHEKKPPDLWNTPCWRYLGSALFGEAAAFVAAHTRQTTWVGAGLPRLTWEINYWRMMPERFCEYPADHDDSMLGDALLRALETPTEDPAGV